MTRSTAGCLSSKAFARTRRIGPALVLALLAGACSAGRDVARGEAAVVEFHRAVDSSAFDGIYAGSSRDLKASASSASLIQLLSAVHRKLGDFQSGKTVNWNDNVALGNGRFVTIVYAARYARGDATENFLYRLDGDHAALAGYHINSVALIVN